MQARQPLLSELSRRRKLAVLTSRLDAPSRILEVGSGDGWFGSRLRAAGHDVVMLDLAEPADVVGNITNWESLGLERHSFDCVVALEVIEHVDCLDDLRALCREDGLIFLSSPHPNWDWVMKWLEAMHLTQRRTSPHSNLVDFSLFDLERVTLQRPAFIHQVGLFRNVGKST